MISTERSTSFLQGALLMRQRARQPKIFCREFPTLPVRFEGTVYGEEKMRLLGSSDIFVFPTYYPFEGHPWVIVEAMAFGLPIISTDQGAIRESVIDGVNGFIIEKSNPTQIAEKIKILVQNAELRMKMGRESRLLYETHFTEAHMVEKMAAVFQAIINEHVRHSRLLPSDSTSRVRCSGCTERYGEFTGAPWP